MTTSGTTAFNPSLGEFVHDALGNCGVRRTEVTPQHMADARFSANLINSRWSASGINLWAVDMQTQALTAGQATYSVPVSTIFLLDVYISQGNPPTDTLIFPISRSDYAAIADKAEQGTPTSYWFDRTLSPTITLWNVPSDSGAWTLKYYRMRQIQDSALTNGSQEEIPFTHYDAFSWELSWRLAAKYAPDKVTGLKALAKEAWDIAISAGTENVPIELQPDMSSYFR